MPTFRYDRELGDRIRGAVARVPAGSALAAAAARALSPTFHFAVGAAIAEPGTRPTGVRMLLAGGGAAVLARGLRDGIGRPRPGAREEGGFPSRHAAAAAAITAMALSRKPALGLLLGGVAVVGLTARVASAEHEPADIAAGALLGLAVAHVVAHPASPLRFLSRSVGVR